jgi:hypothetical protein
MLKAIDPVKWHDSDSHISPFLRERNIPMFVVSKNYGEHGGFMNPEHAQDGCKLFPHRAETLMSPLHFCPSTLAVAQLDSSRFD